MALYIPHSNFHLARLLYVRPENFGPYYVCASLGTPIAVVRNLNYLTIYSVKISTKDLWTNGRVEGKIEVGILKYSSVNI